MTIEALGADQWIYSTLAADGSIQAIVGTASPRIYTTVAPRGAATPYVLFDMQAGRDENVCGGGRAAADLVYIVRAVGQSESYAPVAALANRIDSLLHGKKGTAPTYAVAIEACHRIETIRYPETLEGITLQHLGGLYRIAAVS